MSKNKWQSRPVILCISMSMAASVVAGEITYRKDIRPLWEKQCSSCHGDKSPYLGDFLENKKKYKEMIKGSRMDTYADLIFFVGWPDAGAIMRRLDGGSNTSANKPGNMYQYLGASDAECKKNLALFKAWVGHEAWKLNRWNERGDMPGITKKELDRIKVKY